MVGADEIAQLETITKEVVAEAAKPGAAQSLCLVLPLQHGINPDAIKKKVHEMYADIYVCKSYMSATWETIALSTAFSHRWDAAEHEATSFDPCGSASAGRRRGVFQFSWAGGSL